MNRRQIIASALVSILLVPTLLAYPVDGYNQTCIRRLLYADKVVQGEVKGTPIPEGAQKKYDDIELHLYNTKRGDSLWQLPEPDPVLQRSLNSLFPNLHESYAIAILDITPGRPVRYASRQEDRGFQPGSVGKLAVLSALFCELENIYPNSFEERKELLISTSVKGGPFAVYDSHTVPFYDPATGKFFKRPVNTSDIFTLYEWTDHMMSVSNNGAAAVVWREAMLMRAYGRDYEKLTDEDRMNFFKTTNRKYLSDLSVSVVSDPLRSMGITSDEWRLGTMFTNGACDYVPPQGGSIGTPRGLMKFLVEIERGVFLDKETCLEMKRLMYMTDRRIRYAANKSIKDAAVYFKSGSLYKCRQEAGYSCEKYKGNVDNFMNSVAIIEQPDGRIYFVVLMSNVLRKNSNIDHNTLAGRIDKLISV